MFTCKCSSDLSIEQNVLFFDVFSGRWNVLRSPSSKYYFYPTDNGISKIWTVFTLHCGGLKYRRYIKVCRLLLFEPSLHYTADDLNIEGTSRFVACCWLNISQPFKKYLTNLRSVWSSFCSKRSVWSSFCLRSVWSSFSNKSVFWEENEKKDGLTLLKCLI